MNKIAWKPAKLAGMVNYVQWVNHDKVILKITLSLACLFVLWNNWEEELIQRKSTNSKGKWRNTKRGPTSKLETIPKSKWEEKVFVKIQIPSLGPKPLISCVKKVNQTRGCGVSHCGLAIYIKKYLKAKEEELWKLKYFTMQKYNLPKKKSSKRNQNPSRYYNSIINLKFQHKPKYNLSKIHHIKI